MNISQRATVRHESGIEVEHALVLAATKSNLAGVEFEMQRLQNKLQELLAQESGFPVVTIFALTGSGSKTLVLEVLKAYERWTFA